MDQIVEPSADAGFAELAAIQRIIINRIQAIQKPILDAGFAPHAFEPRPGVGPWDAEKAKAAHERARLWNEASIVKSAATCALGAVADMLRLTASMLPAVTVTSSPSQPK